MKRAACAIGAMALGAACGGGELVYRAPPSALGEGRFVLAFEDRAARASLLRETTTLVSLDPSSFEIDGKRGVSWSPNLASTTDGRIDVDFGGGVTARVSIGVAGAGRYSITLRPSAPAKRMRVRLHSAGPEAFYGLGDARDSVDSRGRVRDESGHAPSSLVIGTRGWALFVDSNRIGTFDVASTDPSVVEATYDGEDALHFDLLAADTALDVYPQYVAMAGASRPPPDWALGALALVDPKADIGALAGLPISGVVLDGSADSVVGDFDLALVSKATLAAAHDAGLKVAAWSVPYASPSSKNYEDAKPFFAQGTATNPWGPPIDFSNPLAAGFWRKLVRQTALAGIDGFLLDRGEDVEVGHWTFAGGDETTMRHRYSGLYHRVYADGAIGHEPTDAPRLDTPLPALFVRSIHDGDDNGVIVTVADAPDLRTALTMGLSISASSYPFVALAAPSGLADAARARWIEATALLPTMIEANTAGDVFATYGKLHRSLYPYLATHAKRATTGVPLVRPLGLAYPELGVHPSDAWLLGDDLFVAPIVDDGTQRAVTLPPGTWRDFRTGEAKAGSFDVEANLAELPLYVREGALVPLMEEGTIAAPGKLTVLAAAGPPRSIVLFDGTRIESTADGSVSVTVTGSVFTSGYVVRKLP